MIKKILAILTAISLSSSAFAGGPDLSLSPPATTPGKLTLGATGLYLQPSPTDGDLDYALLPGPLVGSTNSYTGIAAIKPDYKWSYEVHGSYLFSDTQNDIAFSYFHYDNNKNAPTLTSDLATPIISVNSFSPESGAPLIGGQNVTANANYHLEQVDLTDGEYMWAGTHFTFHPLIGLRWAELDRRINSNFTADIDDAFLDHFNVAEKSNFSGIGPMIGGYINYHVTSRFGFVARGDMALLAGDIDANNDITLDTPNNPTTSTSFNFLDNKHHRTAYVTDIKLGANYAFGGDTLRVILEGGWNFSKYFDAIDRVYVGSVGGVTLISRTVTSNLTLQGPYVKMDFAFNT